MARSKKADNPEPSQETTAVRETTDLHIPESGLMEDSPSREKEINDPGAANFKDEAREAIFNKRREFLEKENGIVESGVIDAKPITENAVEDRPREVTPEGISSPSVSDVAKIPPTTASSIEEPAIQLEKFPITVNGQIVEYTLDELKQQAQLGVGARQKFDEAAQLRQQAALDRQQAQQLMFASQQNFQPQAGNNQQAQPQITDIPETELRDIAKRLNYGSEDEQVKALKEAGILFSKAAVQPNQLTPDALVNIATQNALNVITANQEQEILKNEFKDIVSDPAIAYATDFIAKQLGDKYAALGQQKTRLEILREAGNTAKERYLKPLASTGQTNSSAQPSPTVVDMTNKIERKRAAPQPPTSANKVASDESQPYGVPSLQALDAARKNAFNYIAKRRGQ